MKRNNKMVYVVLLGIIMVSFATGLAFGLLRLAPTKIQDLYRL